MKVEKCKGFKDLSPDEMESFRLIEGIFRDACLKWGYREVRTPTLEYLYLFTSVGTLTPGMLRRVYSFLDWDGWSGERVVMKPDGTIPVARMYIDDIKKGLARLFYVTSVFMFEETGKKSRERWQCGAELIGENTVVADMELVALALDVFKRLDIADVNMKISHAGLIRAILEKLELSQAEKNRLFDRILDGDMDVLRSIKAGDLQLIEVLNLLLKLKGRACGFLKNIKALTAKKLPQLRQPLDNFIAVVEMLDRLGCEYKIDLSSGKGFEYYTGIIFNIYTGKEIIGGGGRYDNLISQMGGKAKPAAGFALYMSSLIKLLEPQIMAKPLRQRVLLKITAETAKKAFELAEKLRSTGLTVELALGEEPAAECGWTIELEDYSPGCTLINQANNSRKTFNNIEDVMASLGCEANGAEDSPA
ncbi:ATP phosphoribosyltransferase regulatory subunit [Chloroflexota bacterium]